MYFNDRCYKLKTLEFENGFLDESVDITYIITMQDSITRHKNIMLQLSKLPPTKNVIIVYNTGFKKCYKTDGIKQIDISVEDLTYTYMYIFNDAKQYNKILILEDDFQLIENNVSNKSINIINNFINKNDPNIYYLGCVPIFINIFTIFSNNIQTFFEFTTHSLVINQKTRTKLLNLYMNNSIYIKDIDAITSNFISNKYIYKNPIYIQCLEETENKKNWGKGANSKAIFIIGNTIGNLVLTDILKLNNKQKLENNWEFAYKTLKVFNLFLLLSILVIIFLLARRFIYKK